MPARRFSRSTRCLLACLLACLLGCFFFAASGCVTDDPIIEALDSGDTGGTTEPDATIRDAGGDAADAADAVVDTDTAADADADADADVTSCDPGYEADGQGACVDIDECAADTHDCSPNAACENGVGDFTCACIAGFTDVDGDGRSCIDVDECADGTDDCAPDVACNNTAGGWMCGACPEGYDDLHGDGTECVDTDECASGVDDCDPLVRCTNTEGGYTCGACPNGYRDSNGDGTVCDDLDECTSSRNDCDPLVTCTNTAGGYTCGACPSGYDDVDGDGTECVEIDECATGVDRCDPLAACTNTEGGHLCACPAGYTDTNGDGSACTDTDECATNQDNCDALATCANTPGGFTCTCAPGYLDVHGDGRDCQDIDECVTNQDNCASIATCTNTPGAFLCACPSGYADTNGDGSACADIDECATNRDNCAPLATCANTTGGFTCTCPSGYSDPNADGSVCEKIPACGDGVVDSGEACDDGASNSDTAPNACRRDCRVAECGDGVTDSGEMCDDANSDDTDGCDAACIASCVVGGGALGCNGAVTSRNDAAGSTDVIKAWACGGGLTNHSGPEMVYSFVPDATGPVVVELTGLTSDLDLFVFEAVNGACEHDDSNACVPGGSSSRAGTNSERIEFDAVAGTTYYLVVDGYAGNVSPFTLSAGPALTAVQLHEVHGGAPDDFVELVNRSGCDAPLDRYTLSHLGDCSSLPLVFDFGPTHTIRAGGVFRVVDSSTGLASNEVYAGSNICDNVESNGYTLLCDGPCDVDTAADETCANVTDALVRRFDGPTSAPTCIAFEPAPFDTTGMSADQSIRRQAFTGASPTWKASDWAAGAATRD